MSKKQKKKIHIEDEITQQLRELTRTDTRDPIQMPREFVWAIAAGGLAIIVTAWPALILGAVLGAMGMLKLGCKRNENNHRDT